MPIILQLVPTRPSFCPGDILTATLEVWHQHVPHTFPVLPGLSQLAIP